MIQTNTDIIPALPKVCVIIPCFNDGLYIKESIASVRCQTHKKIEIVVVNDGSTDSETLKVLDSLKNEKDLIVIDSINMGPSHARNLGIKSNNSEYILPLDSDDLIGPTYIEKALNIFKTKPEIGIVYCKAEFIGLKSGPWDLPEFSKEIMAWDNCIFNAGLFRRSDWEKSGGYDESLIYGSEDYDFWLSLLELNRGVYCIPEVLFYYRIKSQSRSTIFATTSLDQKVKMYHKIFLNHQDFFIKNIEYIYRKRLDLEHVIYINHKKLEKLKNNKLFSITYKILKPIAKKMFL